MVLKIMWLILFLVSHVIFRFACRKVQFCSVEMCCSARCAELLLTSQNNQFFGKEKKKSWLDNGFVLSISQRRGLMGRDLHASSSVALSLQSFWVKPSGRENLHFSLCCWLRWCCKKLLVSLMPNPLLQYLPFQGCLIPVHILRFFLILFFWCLLPSCRRQNTSLQCTTAPKTWWCSQSSLLNFGPQKVGASLLGRSPSKSCLWVAKKQLVTVAWAVGSSVQVIRSHSCFIINYLLTFFPLLNNFPPCPQSVQHSWYICINYASSVWFFFLWKLGLQRLFVMLQPWPNPPVLNNSYRDNTVSLLCFPRCCVSARQINQAVSHHQAALFAQFCRSISCFIE